MTVTNLERWAVEKLANELQPCLKECGRLAAVVDEVGSIERWRKAARLAGRSLGHPVRTTLSPDRSTVLAILDQPVKPGEQAEAAQRVADWVFGPSPHLRLVKPEDA